MVLCETCAATKNGKDPTIYKHKADDTSYVGVERASRLVFGACPARVWITFLRAIIKENIRFPGVALEAKAERTVPNRSQLSPFKFIPSLTTLFTPQWRLHSLFIGNNIVR
jgi:hypothetical protein